MVEKKYGIVLPSYIYNDTRRALADEAFRTLALTRTDFLKTKPAVFLLTRGNWPLDMSGINNFVIQHDKTIDAVGTEQTLAYGSEFLSEFVDYIIWLGDDAKFHPEWLYQLDGLIDRHPDAYSYSVYRSAHVTYHRPTGVETELDVETVCLCGHGLTFSSEEWRKWGIKWSEATRWPSPAGDTLDLHHSWVRQNDPPGNRWCTKKSYIEHTGKVGVHCTGSEPEYAIDFQGTGA